MKNHPFLIISLLFLLISFPMNSFAQDNLWKNWVKSDNNPIVYDENTWFDVAFNPIIIHEEGKYKMWFTGFKSGQWARQIGYAESFDGLNWEFHEEPVIACGQYGTSQRNKLIGNVLRVDDTLRIWYGGFNDYFTNYSTYYGWSLDGLQWNLHPTPVLRKGEPGQWDEEGAFGWPVYYDGTTYHILFGNNADIGYATSSDGIHCEKDDKHNPVFVRGPHGSWYDEWVVPGPVIVKGDIIYMFFGASDGSQGNGCAGYFRSGYAWSNDFINWTIGNNNEYVLDKGKSGEWDNLAAWVTCIVKDENQYKMWYSGNNQEWAMGYASLVKEINESTWQGQISLNISPSIFINDVLIKYSVPFITNIKLEVYNLNGQFISTLVTELCIPGSYEVLFNGNGLVSGTYCCRLTTQGGTITKKFIKLD